MGALSTFKIGFVPCYPDLCQAITPLQQTFYILFLRPIDFRLQQQIPTELDKQKIKMLHKLNWELLQFKLVTSNMSRKKKHIFLLFCEPSILDSICCSKQSRRQWTDKSLSQLDLSFGHYEICCLQQHSCFSRWTCTIKSVLLLVLWVYVLAPLTKMIRCHKSVATKQYQGEPTGKDSVPTL